MLKLIIYYDIYIIARTLFSLFSINIYYEYLWQEKNKDEKDSVLTNMIIKAEFFINSQHSSYIHNSINDIIITRFNAFITENVILIYFDKFNKTL